MPVLDDVIQSVANSAKKHVIILGEGPFSRLQLAVEGYLNGRVRYNSPKLYDELEQRGMVETPTIQKVGEFLESSFKIKIDYDKLQAKFSEFGVR